ncbi:MAG: J domain-containing protein [Armatimonadetes bacterium]|nr:J domain-containing protein [Anaerolineae bacterium]
MIADFAIHANEQARQQRKVAVPLKPSHQRTPWDILQISAQSDKEAVKNAYRRLARLYHPDLNRSHNATAEMQALNAAYDAALSALDNAGQPL